jgi:hypothetical protein
MGATSSIQVLEGYEKREMREQAVFQQMVSLTHIRELMKELTSESKTQGPVLWVNHMNCGSSRR